MNSIITTIIRFVLLVILYCLLFPLSLSAQNLLNYPESVVHDSLFNRYLVSNWANGSIVQIDSNGVHSYFVTGHGSINGIYIADNKVFAGCSTKVKGFDLATRDTVMDLLVQGAVNLNDVTADNSGNIYITDFNARAIVKVNIQSQAYSTFVSGLTLQPNGILFDQSNNRLLLCSFGFNIPILAISLEDSSVSVVANTTLAQCDGFAKDDFGNYYISSWATNSIYRFDSVFSNPPEIFYTNSEAPVDISYNSVDDLLAAPIMWLNMVVYLPVNLVSVDSEGKIPQVFKLFQNYPNPFNPDTKISFNLPVQSYVSIKVYDILGNEISKLVDEEKPVGSHEIKFNAAGLTNGIYLYRFQAGDPFTDKAGFIKTEKMILLK